ncbi:MAG: hypothetical protein WAM44_21925, partial [Chthoniobacterales bacterium]
GMGWSPMWNYPGCLVSVETPRSEPHARSGSKPARRATASEQYPGRAEFFALPVVGIGMRWETARRAHGTNQTHPNQIPKPLWAIRWAVREPRPTNEAATRRTPNAKRQTALSGYNLRFQEDA